MPSDDDDNGRKTSPKSKRRSISKLFSKLKRRSASPGDHSPENTVNVRQPKKEERSESPIEETATPMETSSTPDSIPRSAKDPSEEKSPSSRDSSKDEKTETLEAGITVTSEPGEAPKLSRSASKQVARRPAQLFDHLPSATAEATSTFEILKDCTYQTKYIGSSNQEEEDNLVCDCKPEWGRSSMMSFTSYPNGLAGG